MLALVSSFVFLLAEGGGSSTNTWEEVRAFWDHYLNYPGFELWKFINLAIFVTLLVHFLRKPVGEAFKAKREVIRAELIKAEEEKQAALQDLTSVEARLVGVDQEKDSVMKAAREEIDYEKKRLAAQAEFEAAKLAAQAEGELTRLGQVARLQLRRFAVDESLRMAEEKLRSQVDNKTDSKLVKAGIEAIGGLN
ncbi:MAG TPA: hypothetical protein VMS29_05735 [Pyrinomonadaceae bacterium]|jgi:F0F1-type ATP synthase membrane subunit b/b'|nr:hypothetical protein [Pyrinomonadaceae bacterium]